MEVQTQIQADLKASTGAVVPVMQPREENLLALGER